MLNPDFLQRFTTHLKEALQKALSFAVINGRDMVEPGDLLVGILLEKGSMGGQILLKSGLSAKAAEDAFRGTPHVRATVVTPDLTPVVKRIIEACVLTAHVHEHKYVGTEHLLSAILEVNDAVVIRFLEQSGVAVAALKEQVIQVLKSTSHFPDLTGDEPIDADPGAANPTSQAQQHDHARAPRSSALEVFTRELTTPETAAALDPVIGRDSELERVIQILCRRTKNNPLLLGEPGVGKTAIIEGLAKRLAEGDVPDVLHGKRLLTLDLALTVAGTMYRGEFEARLKQIIDEVREDPNIILFIDEIHTIVGAGSTTGSLDAANILKPALARGDIRCIGATTWMEFKKHIEPDAALERRFQPITVDEPTAEATMEILRGLAPKYAAYHHVTYTPEALAECVRLSERYLSDRHFPDKAIDLMDEAAARVNAQRRSEERMERLSSLEVAIHAAEEQKEQAVAAQDLVKANAFHEDVTRLRKEYETLKAAYERARGKDTPRVEANHVAEVVARMASVSLSAIQATDREQLTHFAQDLQAHILGQEKAVSDIAEVIARSRLGLHDPKRPKAALLLVGPSGTGKTETARFIARHVFGREDALIRIDMSEFAESHTVSKLVGSPAGYVGYREGTKLTDAIRKRPHAVILFDELEKAHGDVQNLLLQMLEDGTISDGTGRSVTLRHAYVILTSNIGSERASSKSLGFGNILGASPILQEVRDRFKPEFLNRLDRIVVYEPLTTVSMKEIVQRELTAVMQRVQAAQNVALHAGDDVLAWLLTRPLPPEEGARAARRLIEQEITSLLSRLLAEKPQKKIVRIRATSQGLRIT